MQRGPEGQPELREGNALPRCKEGPKGNLNYEPKCDNKRAPRTNTPSVSSDVQYLQRARRATSQGQSRFGGLFYSTLESQGSRASARPPGTSSGGLGSERLPDLSVSAASHYFGVSWVVLVARAGCESKYSPTRTSGLIRRSTFDPDLLASRRNQDGRFLAALAFQGLSPSPGTEKLVGTEDRSWAKCPRKNIRQRRLVVMDAYAFVHLGGNMPMISLGISTEKQRFLTPGGPSGI